MYLPLQTVGVSTSRQAMEDGGGLLGGQTCSPMDRRDAGKKGKRKLNKVSLIKKKQEKVPVRSHRSLYAVISPFSLSLPIRLYISLRLCVCVYDWWKRARCTQPLWLQPVVIKEEGAQRRVLTLPSSACRGFVPVLLKKQYQHDLRKCLYIENL